MLYQHKILDLQKFLDFTNISAIVSAEAKFLQDTNSYFSSTNVFFARSKYII